MIAARNVGPATFRALVNQFGGAEAALDALPALSRRGGRPSIRVFTEAEAEAELEAAEHAGARLVVMGRRAMRPRSPMSMRRHRSSMPKAGSILPTARSSPWSAPATILPFDRSSPGCLPLSSGLKASSLLQVLPAASTPPRILPRSSGAQSPCSPAASTSSTRPRMQTFSAPLANGGAQGAHRFVGTRSRWKVAETRTATCVIDRGD
jgi:hypothetical protein